ncbi:MAG: DUF2505 domain-containing protein [Micrococcales bacterium]|nr:DUF2505 domain-containing protein [Micrococcales bacterium]
MRITETDEYPCTPAELFALLRDEGFQQAKCEATGALSHTVSISGGEDAAVIETERTLPTDRLPDFAKSMVGDTLKVRERQEWGAAAADGSRTARLSIDIQGVPVTLSGTRSLAPAGAGALETTEADLRASVPLFGSRIEKAAAPVVEAALDAEHRVALEWLARR